MTWTPLPQIARGLALGRFQPPEEPAGLLMGSLEFGDEVFVLEKHASGQWYRGYVVAGPTAQAAFHKSLDLRKPLNPLEDSPKPLDSTVSVGVFPVALIAIKEHFDLPEVSVGISNGRAGRSGRQSLASVATSGTGVTSINSISEADHALPPIPALRIKPASAEPLIDDIAAVIQEWHATYLYHHFVRGNYAVVKIVVAVIRDLGEIRRRLLYGLLTANERVIARKKAVWQITRVTKLLHKGIVVREPATGDIMASDPVRMAQEQMLLSLSPNYPDHATVGDIVKVAKAPKHILVDFKSCSGQVYGRGLTVQLMLRNKTQRLSESFSIAVSQDTVVTELSAVLFKDLPISITRDDVYLVAQVFEEVDLVSDPVTKSFFGNSMSYNALNGPNSSMATPRLARPRARRGVAAGVTDVSRLFRMEESIESPFTLKMFGSFLTPEEPDNDNRGWGELVDRIIRGRPRGVATTRRAEAVVCTVKEFEAPAATNIDYLASDETTHRAVGYAKSLHVHSLSDPRNDLYFSLGRLALVQTAQALAGPRDLLTVSMTSLSGRTQFAQASNSTPVTAWDAVSVVNGEAIGDMVGCFDFDTNDTILFHLFANGRFLGRASMPVWHGNRVASGRHTLSFVQDGPGGGTGTGAEVATLALVVEFVGNGLNTDLSIDKMLNWKLVYDTLGPDELTTTLARFKVVEDTEFRKHFHDVMDALFEMVVELQHLDNEPLRYALFNALVYTLEKVTARSKDFAYLGEDYLASRFNFAGVADFILAMTERYLLNFHTVGYQLVINQFRVCDFLARLVAASAQIDCNRGKAAQELTVNSLRQYLKRLAAALKLVLCRTESVMEDLQLAAVQNMYQWFFQLRSLVPPDEITQYLIEVVDSVRTDSARINTHRLLLIRQLATSWLYRQSKYRPHLTAYTIKWTLPFWLNVRDFDAISREHIRLTCCIFAAQFKVLWPLRHQEPEVCRRFGQLLPLGAKLYTQFLQHFETTAKPAAAVFSPLFQDQFPFETRALDSSIQGQAEFDEALIELGVVFALLVRLANVGEGEVELEGELENKLGLEDKLEAAKLEGQEPVKALKAPAVVSAEEKTKPDDSRRKPANLAANIIRTCTSMLNCTAFPRTWVSLLAVHLETVLSCMEYLAPIMKQHFIPPPDKAEKFDSALWYSYLSCILQLAGSEHVALEHQAAQVRTAVFRVTKDLRTRAGVLLLDVWNAIGWPATDEDRARFGLEVFGGFQVQMFGGETSLVRSVLDLCLARHPHTQHTAVHVLKTMVVSEWALNEDLTGLQREMIASLDDIFQSRTFLPEYHDKRMFDHQMRTATASIDREDEAYPFMAKLLDDVEEFLDLLLDLYNIPSGDAFNDDRVFHALNILNFLKDIDRVEIFSRYVSDIAQWNRSKMNYTQAGLALKLLASAYDWSFEVHLPATTEPDGSTQFPAQTAFERKEALYEDIIQNFTRGRAYENAIEATKELVQAYETITFDFKKLAAATRILAKLYDSVESVDRLANSYFRVAYIGLGFPRSLRNRQFIFEGAPYEKLESIHDRLHSLYPGATIVTAESQARVDGQFLYVTTVSPEPDSLHTPFLNRNALISPGAKEFQARLNMRFFTYSRPLPGNTSPLDLWVERVVYETYQNFPTIVKRSEVKSVSVTKLSPIENALATLDSKTRELLDLEVLFNLGRADQGTVSRLDLVLSGSVDSPVNGGIQVYRQFFADAELQDDPESATHLNALEVAFLDYAAAIQRCMVIHARVVPPTLRPLHDSLVELFERNFAHEITLLSGAGNYELARRSVLGHKLTGSDVSSASTVTNRVARGRSNSGAKNGSPLLYDYPNGNKSSALDNLLSSVSTSPGKKEFVEGGMF